MLLAVLAAILVATALATGAARAMLPAAGTMTICAGNGIVVVAVDGEGRPTERPILCPDCAEGLAAALGAEPPRAPGPALHPAWAQGSFAPARHPRARRPAANGARAPPA